MDCSAIYLLLPSTKHFSNINYLRIIFISKCKESEDSLVGDSRIWPTNSKLGSSLVFELEHRQGSKEMQVVGLTLLLFAGALGNRSM